MTDDYFCRASYQRLLRRALELGYRTSTFSSFEPPNSQPVLLLRHDLDHSLRRALPIARLEADLGVHATYFVQVACAFYNLLSSEGRAVLRELGALGHEIGLHYDATRYGDGGLESLRFDTNLVSHIAGQACVSGSQHVPIASAPLRTRDVLLHEAYEDRFTAPPMHYISDSLLAWRQARPDDLLEQRLSFQFLTHPENWASDQRVASIEAVLEHTLEEELAALRRNTADTVVLYRNLLANRAALDRQFVERRSRQTLQ